MNDEPTIVERGEQPYIAIAASTPTARDVRRAADRGFPALFRWLARHGLEPVGPPFIRFCERALDGRPLAIEVAVGVEPGVEGDDEVELRTLPAGRWLTMLHRGPYRSASEPDLLSAHMRLQLWVAEQGETIAHTPDGESTLLGGCVECYAIGPVEEHEPSAWETGLAYLLA
jgi:effector-binding domain-containing protein